MAKKFSALRARMTPEQQARTEARTRELLREEMLLSELREARQMSQEQLAEKLHKSQSAISKLEKRTDAYISTLREVIHAMDGELDIIARFPEGEIRITQFEDIGRIGSREAGPVA